MNIGFDFDDTLDQCPPFFSFLSHLLIDNGHKVYIVTDILPEYREYREGQLEKLNIAYTELVITGNKLKACVDREIDFIMDDMADYYHRRPRFNLQVFDIKERMYEK